MSLFLGIDVSTTGSKALLINRDGDVVSSATRPHALSTPRPLWSEQEPEDWWQAVQSSVRRALLLANVPGGAVSAIGLTGQMHGLVLLDAQKHTLRPAIPTINVAPMSATRYARAWAGGASFKSRATKL